LKVNKNVIFLCSHHEGVWSGDGIGPFILNIGSRWMGGVNHSNSNSGGRKNINVKQEAEWNIQVARAFWVVSNKANVHFG
jgi:hypothetical protein